MASDYCNGCERTVRLRKDGTFQGHNVRTLGLRCPASGLTPAEAKRRNLWDDRKGEPRTPVAFWGDSLAHLRFGGDTVTRISVDCVTIDPALERKLKHAAKVAKQQTESRDRLIGDAFRAGGGLREIARSVGLTHAGVRRILVRDGHLDESNTTDE